MPTSFDVVAVLLLENIDVMAESRLLDDDDELSSSLLDDELLPVMLLMTLLIVLDEDDELLDDELLDDELLLFFRLLKALVKLLCALTQAGAASIMAATAIRIICLFISVTVGMTFVILCQAHTSHWVSCA